MTHGQSTLPFNQADIAKTTRDTPSKQRSPGSLRGSYYSKSTQLPINETTM